MPRGPLSLGRPRLRGPPYSRDPLPQGPHYPDCPRTREHRPYSGYLLPRRLHHPDLPKTRRLCLSGPPQAWCPRAQSAPTPSSRPRSPGRAVASCISLPGLLAVGRWLCCSLLPWCYSGASLCPPPCVPLGFPSPSLPMFTRLCHPVCCPYSQQPPHPVSVPLPCPLRLEWVTLR